MADFCLVSRRVLDEAEYQVFRFYFLLGGDWRICCTRLRMDRGNFFHAVYRIQQKLGKAFAELEPYPLYPVSEYFGGVINKDPFEPLPPLSAARSRKAPPLILPLSA